MSAFDPKRTLVAVGTYLKKCRIWGSYRVSETVRFCILNSVGGNFLRTIEIGAVVSNP